MLAKIKNNYQLANILVRILFVITFVFANWQSGFAATVMILGEVDVLIALLSTVLLGTIFMFLLPVLVNFALNLAKIYSVPRAEYCLLAHAFFALGFLLCGLFNLVHLFTPVLVIWGGVLFPFISSLISALLFYKVTAKLYFNDVTVVHYFKMFAIIYLLLVVILEVL